MKENYQNHMNKVNEQEKIINEQNYDRKLINIKN